MGLQKLKDGSGGSWQGTRLIAGAADKTSAAADIDVSDADFVTLFTACVVYVALETTKTMTIPAGATLGVADIDLLHVDGIVEYTLF